MHELLEFYHHLINISNFECIILTLICTVRCINGL